MGLRGSYRKLTKQLIGFRNDIFAKKIRDFRQIPVIINNYNRLTFLKMQIEALEKRGYRNIYIIDNASTYPPLLEYYKQIPYEIFYLEANVGYLSFWKTDIHKKFRYRRFVYTDSDIVPDEGCPDDFMEKFYGLLKKYPKAVKVGFALRIDDLPDHFRHKSEVIEWESQFWREELEKDVYLAPIDTTFALYRPNAFHHVIKNDLKRDEKPYNIRVGGKYAARHMPWYNDTGNLSEEESFYIDSCKTSTHWTEKDK